MTSPRLEIDLDRIHHNARELVDRLGARGVRIAGVTKATLGSPEIARTLLRAGIALNLRAGYWFSADSDSSPAQQLKSSAK